MKKTLKILFIPVLPALFAFAFFSGCSKEESADPQLAVAGQCDPVTYPFWAGAGKNDTTKGTNVGSVTYSNDSVNLYVTVYFPGPSCPKEVHLWAGSDLANLPSTKGGVSFGKFPYRWDPASCGMHTFTIPLSSLFPSGTTDFCNKDLYVSVHAAMDNGETAIGYGQKPYGGSRWGWVATYTVCCTDGGGTPI